jgi:dnd system-associated protein 4
MTLKAIRRLVSDEDICARLAQAPHPRTGGPIFRTFRDLAVFAATVGFEQSRRRPLDGPTDVFVDGRIMERSDTAMDMVYLIGLAAERRQEILSDDPKEEDELAKIFEEYARGGYLDDARSAVESLDDVDF